MENKDLYIVMLTNLYYPTVGGITTYVDVLNSSLKKEGYKSSIITYPQGIMKFESKLGRGIIYYLLHVLVLSLFIPYALLRILVIRIRNKNVVVHGHSANFCLFGAVLSKAFGCKAVHTFHSPVNKGNYLIRRFSPKLNGLIYVSRPTQELYEKHTQASNANIVIIPGGADIDKLHPVSEESVVNLRKELGAKLGMEMEKKQLILFVGRVTENKGIIPLLKAMCIVGKKVKDAHLIVIGPYDKTLDQKECFQKASEIIADEGLGDIVNFLGFVSNKDLITLYQISDIFVCPSIWQEPSPLVVVDAMAAGLPVIATNVGGLPFRVMDGKTGYIVEKNTAEPLADRILRLLRDEKLRREMAAAARKHAAENYSIERQVSDHLVFYKKAFF